MSKSLGNVGRAAGRDQAVRRRHPADVGVRVATMPTTCASARKSSRPRSRPIASCATRCAGCSARSRISATTTASPPEKMPELERLMLHRLAELDRLVRQAYADFDYKRIFAALSAFMTVDLSAFYFDIRKDTLYCDPISSQKRRACLTVLDHLFRATVTWLAPMLPFTAEEAWLSRYPVRGRLGASGAVPGDAGAMARRRAGREMAQGPHRAPRGHRRAGDRARRQAHRLVAGSRSDRARVRPGPVRRAGRRRPRGNLHHLGRDAGRPTKARPTPSGCPT